jgi:hypothetical protein
VWTAPGIVQKAGNLRGEHDPSKKGRLNQETNQQKTGYAPE